MGVSSDGIFFFGMIWKDSEPPWREPSPDEINDPECMPEWEDLYEKRSGKPLKDCPVEIGTHCTYGDGRMYFLAIKETIVRASRGWPEKAATVTEKPEWRSQLEQFCIWMGIEWQEPAWWVTSIYG